jgi:DNA-binding NtrC family response regulator
MSTPPTILVVEDGPGEREALARVLRLENYDVLTAENPQQALRYLDHPVDLILSDLRMGKSSGLDLLRYWEAERPNTPFIMITAYGEVDSAVAAMKLGANDYLTKPVAPEPLLELVRNCLQQRRAATPPDHLRPAIASCNGTRRIVGQSAVMRELHERTFRAAQTDSTVLILGESGTGKELVAQAVHENSLRQAGPFVLVNMAAIPDTLVESELFGHVRGAFTGASVDRLGRFEAANRGTIFIDEIGDFPMASQAKLLRVLENRTVARVGSNQDQAIDVRVVAATSRNLAQMVANGEFREDLFYRLNVVVLQLPPLHERREDIALLAKHFLGELCQANHLPRLRLQPALIAFLESFSWPGNVRQLRNCLESMVVMARGSELSLDDLPRNLFDAASRVARPQASAANSNSTLDDLQHAAIVRTLREFNGNRTRTAEALGISVRTLQRRLREWEYHDDLGSSPTPRS